MIILQQQCRDEKDHFDKEFKSITGMTIAEWKANAEREEDADIIKYRSGNHVLKYEASPDNVTFETINDQLTTESIIVVMNGAEMIHKEYENQRSKYSLEQDMYYSDGQLVQAAQYALTLEEHHWPKNWTIEARDKIACKDRLERLAIAGAFMRSEQERLDQEIKKITNEMDQIIDTK